MVVVNVLTPVTLLPLVAIRVVAALRVAQLLSVALAPGPRVRQMMTLRVWLTVPVRLVRTVLRTPSRLVLLVYRSRPDMWTAIRMAKCPFLMRAMARLQLDPPVFLVIILVLVVLANMPHPLLRNLPTALVGNSVVTASALPVPLMTVSVMSAGSAMPAARSVTAVFHRPPNSRPRSLVPLSGPGLLGRLVGLATRGVQSPGPRALFYVPSVLVEVPTALLALLRSSLVGMLHPLVVVECYLVPRRLVLQLVSPVLVPLVCPPVPLTLVRAVLPHRVHLAVMDPPDLVPDR